MANAWMIGNQKNGLPLEMTHNGVFWRFPMSELVCLLLQGDNFLIPVFQFAPFTIELLSEQYQFSIHIGIITVFASATGSHLLLHGQILLVTLSQPVFQLFVTEAMALIPLADIGRLVVQGFNLKPVFTLHFGKHIPVDALQSFNA